MNENKTQTADPKKVLTPKFRVSFPALFEPKLPPGETDPKKAKFGITMLFQVEGPDAVDITPLKNAVAAVLTEKFGADATKWPRDKAGKLTVKTPFRDGTEKDYDGYGPGIIFCSASANRDRRPGLVFGNKEPINNPNDFYGGCYARATINAYWFDKGVNKGVAFGLNNVQKWSDGEPFSGKSKPENDFDELPMPTEPLSPVGTTAAGAAPSATGAKKDPLGL